MSRPVSRYLHPLEPRPHPAFEPEVERARIAALELAHGTGTRAGSRSAR